ncbi:3-hydroxybutyryl-CoA dehydrogenase (plasmid) [Paroceanicella profunda]|uniref:3-hydroxybutyryl-CoA dehydrogenase n=1 Tax=Paroceanicella profunda TaxID=2579971 RepID=A0A5B8G3T6_9RHOB|nr:3-hydroxyacyl-CoA dehydrogenase NAD-binding domain-containing protein [Paroceanicella profunda]QDL93962.1 3-hydroxybutyryl-CoA dehydrogenase [Paroceanicella profunda]
MPDFATIAIAGAGAMGSGIAQVCAQSGRDVLLFDLSAPARERGREAISDNLDRQISKGRISRSTAETILSRIRLAATPEALAPAGLVIEAIIEKPEPKQALFRALEAICGPETVFATNTSSIGVGEIASALAVPVRLAGLHFFNPAQVMKLVEVVGHAATPPALTERLAAFARDIGKTPVICADSPGFIVNRCARPFYGEALAILEEGVFDAPAIDAAMRARGYRMGPFALIDLVGADINLAATETVWAALGRNPRYLPFPALRAQVARGDLGAKTGRGFVTPAVEAAPAPEAVADRIEAALVNEAAHMCDEGLADAAGIDTAMKLGLNFPRGPFEILAAVGPAEVRARLAAAAATAPDALKPRYAPAAALDTPA